MQTSVPQGDGSPWHTGTFPSTPLRARSKRPRMSCQRVARMTSPLWPTRKTASTCGPRSRPLEAGAGAGVHLCEVFFDLRPDLGTLRPQKDLVA